LAGINVGFKQDIQYGLFRGYDGTTKCKWDTYSLRRWSVNAL